MGEDGQPLHEGSQKVTFPLSNDTPRELQFMELSNEFGHGPHLYEIRVLRPDEVQEYIRSEAQAKIIESLQGQLLKKLDIEVSDEFSAIRKLRESTVV